MMRTVSKPELPPMAFSITEFTERLRTASRSERELWLAGGAVGFGLLILPLFIYFAGNTTLGTYERGGLGTFLIDFFSGLFRPHLAHWLVVTGPYLLIMLVRLLWEIRKRLRAFLATRAAAPATTPSAGRRD
ncbi:MAG TPA: hypothetical protein VE046_17435 [Steroidobacteraceae bacterium]|nr:hypothetical protein [Steroidobacteraceae bacterium]